MQQNTNMDFKNIITFLAIAICSVLSAQTGIGTTTPVNKLEVVATKADPATSGTTANGNFRLGATAGTHVLDFGLSSTSTYSWLQARDKSSYASNYFLSLNPNGGWVGIGTPIPLTTLTVGNAAGTLGGEITLNPTSPTAGEGGQITLKKSLQGGTVDWTIDQVGTSSANARLRIFGGITETSGLAILENGNVGIGYINPTTKLYVNGDITANSVAGTSDRRFKTNIRPVDNALAKVKALQGVYFNWNQKEFPEKEFGSQDELGFIAQEVEKIVPEIVVKEKSKEEYRSVKYDKLVALLVEAIKEQQKQIEGLRNQVKRIKRNKK
jgi:Chaperone of endosialidase